MTPLWNDLLVLWEEWDTVECGSKPGSLCSFLTSCIWLWMWVYWWLCMFGAGCWRRSMDREYDCIGFSSTNVCLCLCLWQDAEVFVYVCVTTRVVGLRCEKVGVNMWIYRQPLLICTKNIYDVCEAEFIWIWSHFLFFFFLTCCCCC